MAYVVAVAALKGGVGKTLVTSHVGGCLHAAGRKVLLVDADPQASLRRWAARAEERGADVPPVIGIEGTRLRKDLQRVAEPFEIAIVDCPPQLGAETRSAMIAADLAVIPATAGPTDLWSLEATLALLDEARGLRDLEARLLLNRADRTTMASVARQAIEKASVPAFDAVLTSRVGYAEATAAGSHVGAHAPGSQAAHEVRRLTKELVGVIRGQA
jgi:chromosome partitioning protein